MPELPEVETVMRGLAPFCEGKAITAFELRRAGLRFPFPQDLSANVTGASVTHLSRRSKYLLFHLSNGKTLLSHLGMSGSFRVDNEDTASFHHEKTRLSVHDHVVMTFDKTTITYNDPRRFGMMDLFEISHPMLDILGVEPLSNAFNATYLYEKSRGKKTPLKTFLLDQSVVAGLGNIYVCEVLLATVQNPFKAANDLTINDCINLVQAIILVLNKAIAAGGSTLKDHAGVTGELGYFSHEFQVYGRENLPCFSCNSPIIRVKQAGRSTFYCESCQRS